MSIKPDAFDPLPWKTGPVVNDHGVRHNIYDANGNVVDIDPSETGPFIIHACNLHEKIVAQLKECLDAFDRMGIGGTQVALNTQAVLAESEGA